MRAGIHPNPIIVSEKYCPGCEQRKPAMAFSICRCNKDGLQSTCKECHSKSYRSRIITLVSHKICLTCKIDKPASDFHKSKRKPGGLHSVCRDCRSTYMRLRLYGITREQYEKMFMAQDGKCAICKLPNIDGFTVDHDHKTNAVRGLLCTRCNFGLGNFRDNPERLQNAINYLKAWEDENEV